MSYRGGAAFAWQADFAQFYLVDCADYARFTAPLDITSEMLERGWHRVVSGLVVYSSDCLNQIIDIRIFGDEPSADPADWRSGQPWTRTEIASACFPSLSFVLISPSTGGPGCYGPIFKVDATNMTVRIQWVEIRGNDSERDGIRLDLWPT